MLESEHTLNNIQVPKFILFLKTAGEFVKMLYERECGVVVMLCGCEEGGVEMCTQYWPTTAQLAP